MADNVAITAGSGTSIATEDIGSVHFQKVIAGATTHVTASPTISTSIYAAGDAVGGLLTFANAARTAGLGGVITGVTILDADQEMAPLELVLFKATFTATADNAVFAPSDADLANCIGSIPISQYSNFSTNSIGVAENLSKSFNLAGTDLFGQLVVRSTPTYTATSDIKVTLNILQD